MWNLVYSNPLCHKRKLAQEQLRHLQNLQQSRPQIDNREPWRPSHSLSKVHNKYTSTTEAEIASKNNILLSKIMQINQRAHGFRIAPHCSSSETLRRREKSKISSENQSILKRLQSASSSYSRKHWQSDIERIQKYRDNLQKTTKTNEDFNLLAQQEHMKRSQTSQSLRRLKTSQGARVNTYETLI